MKHLNTKKQQLEASLLENLESLFAGLVTSTEEAMFCEAALDMCSC